LLQPRKYVLTVVTMSKRGEPPWHCAVLAKRERRRDERGR